MNFLILIVLMASLMALAAPLLQRGLVERNVERRLGQYCLTRAPERQEPALGSQLLRAVAAIGRPLLGKGKGTIQLSAKLTAAGWMGRDVPALFTGIRVLTALACGLLAAWLSPTGDGMRNSVISILAAYLAVGAILSRRAHARTIRMRAELPIAIDVLVMVLEGGAGVEQALRFSVSLSVHPAPICQRAFLGFVTDLERGTPYDLSLMRLGDRLVIEEGQLFMEVLRQALMHGTELQEPLRSLAKDLRQRRLADARAAVGKATTMMTLVMIVCLLPALLTLIGAPAVSAVVETLRNMAK
ncbi:MAG: type secretion system family protein [Rubritepida sp.]|nr:type secretion system family protein [Rubritepida sp.]